MGPKILSIGTVNPPHLFTLEMMLNQAPGWVDHLGKDFTGKVEKIFRNAQVDKRYSVLPIHTLFEPMSFEDKNAIYRQEIVGFAEKALLQALEKADLNPEDIDCIITTSCTGHMSPSLDTFLVNRLQMKPSIQRLPVTEMGCIGGAVGLIYAENYLRAYPDRYVALIAAELTSVTFQKDDFSWANIVSTSIFGDGIACAILGPSDKYAPVLKASRMHHFANTIDLLGFDLSNTGFRMVLDKDLPDVIRQNFDNITKPLLEEHDLTLADIGHYVVHPGGKKILHNIETRIKGFGTDVQDSWSVLKEYGNMSSATVLFILERLMGKPIEKNQKGLLMGFGPGLTAGLVLLEWE